MALTFADTHKMIAYLTKSDASEGFDQIIDLLNASSIKYALTVNPNIYVSCIKQFWISISVKKVNDVTRLQALVDKEKVIITEATIRDALYLDDAESIDCLPNEEIFTELSRMGAQVGDLSLDTTKYSSPALTQKQVDECAAEVNIDDVPAAGVANKGIADVNTDVVLTVVDEPSIPSPPPTTQPPLPSQDVPSTSQDAEISMDLLHTLLETCTTLTRRVKYLEQDKIAQALEITKLKQRVKKLERRNKLKVSKLRRLKKVGTAQWVDTSDDTVMDDEVDVDAEIEESDDEVKPAELQEAVEVVTTAKLITEVVTAASATITAADTPIPAVIIIVVAPTLTTAPSAARKRKGVVIRDLEKTDTPSIIIHSEAKSKDKVQRKEKEDNAVKRYQALKRKPQTKAQARKNMMIYRRNMAGFKMDYFKGMKYDDIHPIYEKYFNSNKLDEEVVELKRHLQIVPNDEDDVYIEATPLVHKVPVVDYEIYTENNKPYYKIIRADGSPPLFLSFLSLLRNFDREDLKVLCELVKERFASSKPKNFSDDFLLTTLTYMFEKPDVQAQMILLVERRYPFSGSTLDQMLNNVGLQVEKEIEVSLELLRFVRQQQQEGFRPE
nr:hypothetical protein [Tanacetum cinerariifolium]